MYQHEFLLPFKETARLRHSGGEYPGLPGGGGLIISSSPQTPEYHSLLPPDIQTPTGFRIWKL